MGQPFLHLGDAVVVGEDAGRGHGAEGMDAEPAGFADTLGLITVLMGSNFIPLFMMVFHLNADSASSETVAIASENSGRSP